MSATYFSKSVPDISSIVVIETLAGALEERVPE
jgi:hypothetical protein